MVKNDKKRQSKRDKKKQQQQQQQQIINSSEKENKSNVAEDLYKEVPDSNFTRSISNPEIVMARRRQQKLEQKLKQIKNRDGGGTLKVFGDTLKPDIPYKTLLMSNQDTAAFAVKETLEKYGLTTEDPDNYCLVQVISPSREERDHGAHTKEFILDDNACPLAILMQHPPASGSIIFQIRRCPPDILTKRRVKRLEQQQQQPPPPQQFLQQQAINIQKPPQQQQPVKQQHQQPPAPQHLNRLDFKQTSTRSIPEQIINKPIPEQQQQLTPTDDFTKYPFLINLTEDPNSVETKNPKILIIRSEFCEIGNNLNNFVSEPPANYLNINMPNIAPRHCAIKTNLQNGLITLLPYFETYVNRNLIKEEHILETNDLLSFGKYALFRFIGPIIGRQFEASQQQGGGFSLTRPLSKNQSESESNIKKIKQQQPPPLPQKPQFHTIERSTIAQNRPLPASYDLLYGEDLSSSDSRLLQKHQPQPQIQSNYGIMYDDVDKQQPKQQQQQQQQQLVEPPKQRKREIGIPGLLEFNDAEEDALLMHISNTNQLVSMFKLAPVYTMYMMLRFRLSHKYGGNSLQMGEKLNLSLPLIHKMVNMIREAINLNHLNKTILPYWLANSSEFLYFLKQDIQLSTMSFDAQELLADCVRMSFYYLINLMQQNLDFVLNAFIDPSDHVEDVNVNQMNNELNGNQDNFMDNSKRPTLRNVLKVLNETMNLLRGSRVNAALTIQLFSQLFHFISTWLFNKLVNDNRSGLCSRYWGAKLNRRLDKIQLWAAKQGLELAADCHLTKILQASFLLQASKHDIQDLAVISANSFSLNSLQIKCLLKNYMPAQGEPQISFQLANNLISIAQKTADELLKSEGRLIQVDEEVDLKLPFMLPEDGHSCDVIKGLPNGLIDYIENLQSLGLCWFLQNRNSTGSWTEYMKSVEQDDQQQQQNIYDNQTEKQRIANVIESTQNLNLNGTGPGEDEIDEQHPQIKKIILNKKNGGLGLSIVGAQGLNQQNAGIYIKGVVPDGAADFDGRLDAGDLLIAVDDNNLMGISQDKAAEILTKSGPTVCLTIAKHAAYYHGLEALLNTSPQPHMVNKEPPMPSHHILNGTSIPIVYQNAQTINNNRNSDFMMNANLPPPPPPQPAAHIEQPKRVQFNNIVESSSITLPPPLPSPPTSANTSKSSSISFFNNNKSKNDSISSSSQQRPSVQFSTTSPIIYPPPPPPQSLSTSNLSSSNNKISHGSLNSSVVSFNNNNNEYNQQLMRTPELPSTKEPQIINRHSFDRQSYDQINYQQQQQQNNRSVVMDFEYESEEVNEQQTPSVIGANEVYLDPRAKIQLKKQQQKMLEKESQEGEKLSFKDKMKLFAKEVGETTPDVNNKIKVSKKQREIESKLN